MHFDAIAPTIVLMDDNLIIRQLLKSELEKVERRIDVNFRIFSTDNGVEGLGYIYALSPDVIIIDSTLPKYSGREVFEFILGNEKFAGLRDKIIILHQGNIQTGDNNTVTFLSKRDPAFLKKLLSQVLSANSSPETTEDFSFKLAGRTIDIANRSDLLLWHVRQKSKLFQIASFIPWVVLQVLENLLYLIYRLLNRRIPEESLDQEKQDLRGLRVRYYPSLLLFFTSSFLLLLYVVGFVTSGIFLFGFRIDPASALRSEEKELHFTKSRQDEFIYDDTKIEFHDDAVSLKLVPITTSEPGSDAGSDNPGGESSSEDPDAGGDNSGGEDEPEDEGEVDEEEVDEEEVGEEEAPESYPQTLGASDSNPAEEDGILANEINKPKYATAGPEIITKEAVIYSELGKIHEFSGNSDPYTSILYQLSPDNENWYYWSDAESRWARTELGMESANTIQELNAELDDYEQEFNSGKLYFKIFLVSKSGEKTPSLEKIVVERENQALTDVIDSLPEEPTLDEVEVEQIDFSEMEVAIFNASYFGGQKIVKGKLLYKDKSKKVDFDLDEEVIKKLKVNVYYSSEEKATKDEFIGNTTLYKNPRGELEFLLKTPSRAGGFVTADVSMSNTDDSGIVQSSELAKPVENSTFTVDSTGDGADVGIDGLCADAGGACTLRAAIQEANGVGGSDNIYFNIPTSDPGYRDYDLPNTVSSGDSLNGDDYWTIRPTSALPNITQATTIDAATQTANVANSNTSGPEIELDGANAGNVSGLNFNAGSSGSVVNGIVINNYVNVSRAAITFNTSNLAITNSYLGTDIAGAVAKANRNGVLLSNASTDIHIGHTTSDGNLISGNTDDAIRINSGNAIVQTISIKGNNIGLNAVGTARISNNYGIRLAPSGLPAVGSEIEIGGSLQSHKNVISGNCGTGPLGTFLGNMRLQMPANGNLSVKVLHNFVGPDLTGENSVGTNFVCPGIIVHGVDVGGVEAPVQIGDNGMGNLFRHNTWIDVVVDNGSNTTSPRRVNIVGNSFGETASTNTSVLNTSVAVNRSLFERVDILNNHFGFTVSDPNFNKQLGAARTAIILLSTNADVKGNKIVNMQERGILIMPNVVSSISSAARLDSWHYVNSAIGGQAILAGSLCDGGEYNCIEGSNKQGLYIFDLVPLNEATIFQDNKFSNNGPGAGVSAEQAWSGMFEIYSGTNRRTDFANSTIDIDLPSTTIARNYLNTFAQENNLENVTHNCLEAADCPLVGHSSGTAGATAFLVYTNTLIQNMITYPKLTEYQIDNSGNVIYLDEVKFEMPHLASQTFSFDGDSTTHPINSGGARLINGENYNDLGEPWTNKPAQSRDVVNQDFGRFQIAEIQYVDANPIQNGLGEWVITVDSTSDEDNVSTLGYDDGGGAYSGGGTNGVNGLSDGKTSLREAIIVANNHAGPEKIHFNIPNTDPGYNAGKWTINTTKDAATSSAYFLSDAAGVQILGQTQPGFNNLAGGVIDIVASDLPASGGSVFRGNLDNSLFSYITTYNNYNNVSDCANTYLTSAGTGVSITISNVVISSQNYSASTPSCWAIADLGNLSRVENSTIVNYQRGIRLRDITLGQTVEIEGNTFHGVGSIAMGSQLYNTSGAGVDVLVTNNTINTYQPTLATNVVVDQGTGFQCKKCIISENQFNGSAAPGSGYSTSSLYINYGVPVGEIEITNNTFHHSNSFAIDDWRIGGDQNFITIEDNDFLGSNNIFIGIDYFATVIPANVEINIDSNNFTTTAANTVYGIILVSKNVNITNNTINIPGYGIYLANSNYENVTMQNNVIVTGQLGIQLVGGSEDSYGVTANDVGDVDTGGPNTWQNFPIIQNIKYLGSNQYELKGDIDGKPSEGPWSIEICKSSNHVSGHGGCSQTLDLFSTSSRSWTRVVTVVGATGNDVFSALATNDIGSTSEFGQYADANPVLQGDGSYVITVNSSSDENNVGTTFYADGDTGTASGGGLVGPNGPANGKTSLREAIIVANNHPGPDKIYFNIPTSDSSYNSIVSGAFGININNALPPITSEVYIDGNSQAAETGDTNPAFAEPAEGSVTGNATTGPEIILNYSALTQANPFILSADNITVDHIGFYNTPNGFGRPLRIQSGNNVRIINSTFKSNAFGAITSTSSVSQNIQILNNVITDTLAQGAVETSSSSVIVEDNQFVANVSWAVAPQGSTAAGTNKRINNNLFKLNSTDGGSYDIGMYVNDSYEIEDNTFVGDTNALGAILIDSSVPDAEFTIMSNKFIGYKNTAINLAGGTEDSYSVTANDTGDVDTGVNDLQNHPVITKVEYYKSTGKYRVYGDLDENAAENPWIVEVCESEGHASGHGGCIQTLEFAIANSPWVVDVEIEGSNGTDGRIFSALATNGNGSTSEFSANFEAVTNNPDYTIIEPPVIPPVIPPPPAIGDTDEDDENDGPENDDGSTDAGEGEDDDGGDDDEEPNSPDDGETPVPTTGGYTEDEEEFDVLGNLGPIIPFAVGLGVVLLASFVLGPLVDLFSRVGPIIGIILPRKRKYWGIVFDVIDGEVIPFASVMLKKPMSNDLVAREITDLQGRYAINAPDGDYNLEVVVSGFKPFIRSISVKPNSEVILDVPMVKTSATIYGAFKQFIYYNRLRIIALARTLYIGLLLLGFVYTAYALSVSPIWINYLFFGLYVIVLSAVLIPALRKKVHGRVVDATKDFGLQAAVVRLYSNKQIEDIALSHANGEVKLHAAKGDKEVYVQKLNYEDNRQKVLVTAGKLDRNIQMQPKAPIIGTNSTDKFSL